MPFTINMTESGLIDACIANDRMAQKKLYDRYKKAMYTLAYRITGDFELADEALQDAFLNIFRHLSSFRRESTLGAWIKIIVVRTSIKTLKKKVTFESFEDYKSEGDYIDWGDHLAMDYLEKAIKSLPEGYRSVFVLIEVEGYTHKEVGKMLEISEGTSKSQLFHAKRKLRDLLKSFDLSY